MCIYVEKLQRGKHFVPARYEIIKYLNIYNNILKYIIKYLKKKRSDPGLFRLYS